MEKQVLLVNQSAMVRPWLSSKLPKMRRKMSIICQMPKKPTVMSWRRPEITLPAYSRCRPQTRKKPRSARMRAVLRLSGEILGLLCMVMIMGLGEESAG